MDRSSSEFIATVPTRKNPDAARPLIYVVGQKEINMKYISCQWIHRNRDEPIMLISELDEQGYEKRKVEIYLNGKIGYADGVNEVNGTILGNDKIPNFNEINKSDNFFCIEIERQEFENIWIRNIINSKKFIERCDVWNENGCVCLIVHGSYFDPIDMGEDEAVEFANKILKVADH